MYSKDAVALLSKMQYKPGSRLYFYNDGNHHVWMEMEFQGYNSTPDPLTGRCDHSMGTFFAPPISLSVRGLDAEQVLAAALNAIVQVETHEAREFWRFKNGGGAPFHPHNMEGERNWNRTRNVPALVEYPPAMNPKHVAIA